MNGDVAHQVEQRIENPCVVGSSPTIATKHAPLDKSGKVASLKRKSSLGSTPRGGTNNLTNNGVCHIIHIWGTLTQFGRVLVFETNGRGFKSLMSLQ